MNKINLMVKLFINLDHILKIVIIIMHKAPGCTPLHGCDRQNLKLHSGELSVSVLTSAELFAFRWIV